MNGAEQSDETEASIVPLELDLSTLLEELDEQIDQNEQVAQQQIPVGPIGSIQQLINDGIVNDNKRFNVNGLGSLNLGDMNITSLIGLNHLLDIERVRCLYLSNNELAVIEPRIFDNLLGITDLIISNNELSEVFSLPLHLKLLDISRNRLVRLEQGVINLPEHLKILYLDNNQLVRVELAIFANLRDLHELCLHDNLLTIDNVQEIQDFCRVRQINLRIENQHPLPPTGRYTKAALREFKKPEQQLQLDQRADDQEDDVTEEEQQHN